MDITKATIDNIRPRMRTCDIDAINNAECEKCGYDYPGKINWGGGGV